MYPRLPFMSTHSPCHFLGHFRNHHMSMRITAQYLFRLSRTRREDGRQPALSLFVIVIVASIPYKWFIRESKFLHGSGPGMLRLAQRAYFRPSRWSFESRVNCDQHNDFILVLVIGTGLHSSEATSILHQSSPPKRSSLCAPAITPRGVNLLLFY
jgi:hypothetical protein